KAKLHPSLPSASKKLQFSNVALLNLQLVNRDGAKVQSLNVVSERFAARTTGAWKRHPMKVAFEKSISSSSSDSANEISSNASPFSASVSSSSWVIRRCALVAMPLSSFDRCGR